MHKINSKWIKEIYRRPETAKLITENPEQRLLQVWP
jgi:hypothetical protein